jgi:hypothetical protein
MLLTRVNYTVHGEYECESDAWCYHPYPVFVQGLTEEQRVQFIHMYRVERHTDMMLDAHYGPGQFENLNA